MTDHFIDLVGGNDANSGANFMNGWKTIKGGALAGRIAPGDTIKISKTGDPVSLAVNAAFVDNNAYLTLASPLTANISDCESAWSVAANVTQADETFNYKEGTKSRKIIVASAFGTGLMAYFATGTLDLHTYQKISFWIKPTSNVAAGVVKLVLCSDVAGATIVNTVTISQAMLGGYWYPIAVTIGALGSSIKSVALYAISDPGTINFYLDNIIACNNLDLQTRIGKNVAGESFYGIRSINGTTVRLGRPQDYYSTSMVYKGTSETVALYRRPTFQFPYATSSSQQLEYTNEDGAVGNLTNYSGGWNMATGLRDGETWFDAVAGLGYPFYLSARNHIKLDHVFFGFGYYGFQVAFYCSDIQMDTVEISHNNYQGLYASTFDPAGTPIESWVLRNMRFHGNGSEGLYAYQCHKWDVDTVLAVNNSNGLNINYNNYSSWKNITTPKNSQYGFSLSNSLQAYIDTVVASGNGSDGFKLYNCPDVIAKSITDNSNVGNGASITYCHGAKIKTIGSASNSNYGIWAENSFDVEIVDPTTSGNTSGAMYVNAAQIFLNNPSFAEATKIFLSTQYIQGRDDFVSVKKYQQTAGDHRIFLFEGTIASEVTIRNTASGFSWKMTPTSADKKLRLLPMNFKLTVLANKEVTINVYVRKDGTYNGNAPRLVLMGGILTGIASDVIDSLTVGVDTWEQLEVKGTPSEDGVLEFYVDCDGTAGNVYVDDFGVSQAA